MDKIPSIIKAAFCKRAQKGSWVYLIAAIPLFLFAMIGREYGAFWLYFIPVMLCFAQFFYPTLIVWAIFIAAFLSASGAYLYLFVKDIITISTGGSPAILVDFDDSFVFVLLLTLLIAICFGMIKYRPKIKV